MLRPVIVSQTQFTAFGLYSFVFVETVTACVAYADPGALPLACV